MQTAALRISKALLKHIYQGFKDFGDNDETAKKETQAMLCARNKERCKEIVKKSEKYFFDINKK